MRQLLLILALCLSAMPIQAKTLLILGDSISASYGMDNTQGWVHLLKEELSQNGYQVVNASISGETTGGGLARLPTLLEEHKPNLIIVELGGNDGLRGYPVKLIRRNLSTITQLSRDAGAQVLLLGMQIPPNYGARYTQQFSGLYQQLAEQFSIPLVPFFLEQVAIKQEWMQRDGIHPKAVAQPQLLENLKPYLWPLL